MVGPGRRLASLRHWIWPCGSEPGL